VFRIVIVVSSFALSILVLSASLSAAAKEDSGGSVLGQRGTLYTVSSQRLARLGVRRVFLLATQHGRSYYRLVRQGRECYGVSRAGAASGPGLIKCFLPQGLPPLVDFSVFEATRDHPQLHVWRLEGIAPDGVVRIGLISRTGKLVAKVPVSRGIYYLASPPKIPLAWIFTYSATGHVIARLRL